MTIRFFVRDHRSTLEQSLRTTIYISPEQFKNLYKNYEFYGYDKRVMQFLFIARNIEKVTPAFLGIEIDLRED